MACLSVISAMPTAIDSVRRYIVLLLFLLFGSSCICSSTLLKNLRINRTKLCCHIFFFVIYEFSTNTEINKGALPGLEVRLSL